MIIVLRYVGLLYGTGHNVRLHLAFHSSYWGYTLALSNRTSRPSERIKIAI